MSDGDASGRKLKCTDVMWAGLDGARLVGSKLVGKDVPQGELRGADLSMAELHGANLTDTDLRGTELVDTGFVGVVGQPKLDKPVELKTVVWDASKLKREKQCKEEIIRCHMDYREIPHDLRLAWNRDILLIDHLIDHRKRKSSGPSWLERKN